VVTGDRFYEVGATDASYPATGWHIRGEMGGFWTPPIKLLDGLWFAVDGTRLSAKSFTSGYGYTRMDLGGGVQRTDVVPDGGRAGLVGLRFDGRARQVRLTVDAHSELSKAYPWGWTKPSQATANLPDTGSFDGHNVLFQEQPNHYAALVGARSDQLALLRQAAAALDRRVDQVDSGTALVDQARHALGTGDPIVLIRARIAPSAIAARHPLVHGDRRDGVGIGHHRYDDIRAAYRVGRAVANLRPLPAEFTRRLRRRLQTTVGKSAPRMSAAIGRPMPPSASAATHGSSLTTITPTPSRL
jgi:hypothetical protein